MRSPIVIGVTGHRSLREQDIQRLRRQVSGELKRIMEQHKDCEYILMDSIASGADTLCAQEALALGMKLVCPLPFPAEEYQKDFFGQDALLFEQLLQKAQEVFVAPDLEPFPEKESRDYHYRQAGIYVAVHSHVLLALWDGKPGKPGGCGTAEIVDVMLQGNVPPLATKAQSDCFQMENGGVVIHIPAPRPGTRTEEDLSVRVLKRFAL